MHLKQLVIALQIQKLAPIKTGNCIIWDNIFIERLWRSLKYELIYIREFPTVSALKKELYAWFRLYNEERFHQGLAYKTPDEVYRFSQAA